MLSEVSSVFCQFNRGDVTAKRNSQLEASLEETDTGTEEDSDGKTDSCSASHTTDVTNYPCSKMSDTPLPCRWKRGRLHFPRCTCNQPGAQLFMGPLCSSVTGRSIMVLPGWKYSASEWRKDGERNQCDRSREGRGAERPNYSFLHMQMLFLQVWNKSAKFWPSALAVYYSYHACL